MNRVFFVQKLIGEDPDMPNSSVPDLGKVLLIFRSSFSSTKYTNLGADLPPTGERFGEIVLTFLSLKIVFQSKKREIIGYGTLQIGRET